MDIHEYQAKELLSNFGVEVPPGALAYSPEQAAYRARELGGDKWIVKAQVHAGGRGKAGRGQAVQHRKRDLHRPGDDMFWPQAGHTSRPAPKAKGFTAFTWRPRCRLIAKSILVSYWIVRASGS